MTSANKSTDKCRQLRAAANTDAIADRSIPRMAYTRFINLRQSLLNPLRMLDGDPHYIATGMAIGVFVGCTPTIPFQTILAIVLAFIFRGSKPAAVIGIWVCNPVTLPLFYYGGFKLGTWLLGRSIPIEVHPESIWPLLNMGLDVTAAMIIGGVVIGILPAAAAYLITRRISLMAVEKRFD